MSDKNKNRRNLLTDIFRYHSDELSGDERNSLEREFQKDPFTEEAGEGYRSISQPEALKDIAELQKRVKKRTSGRSGYIIYSIAASIAILIAVSVIFVFKDKSKQPGQLAENSIQSPKAETAVNQPAAEPTAKEPISNVLTGKPEKKSVPPMVSRSLTEQQKRTATISEIALAENMKNDSIPSIEVAPPEIYASDRRLSTPARAMSKEFNLKPDTQVEVKLDPSLASLSEIVVVGYDVSNNETEAKESDAGRIPPQPSTGKLKFNKYIQTNLHRPDSSSTGQRIVVVLNFLVRTDGSIDSIRIVRSPGKQFSDEAIRVLKSGPSWKPAQENGKTVEDEVRIRIVFR